ncbi:MAG: eight transrane protein EpsH, partial [Verrucomicrobia bacterium]|nr:eight transrane protein EpsH [Verrucomicrobiota bacterium]
MGTLTASRQPTRFARALPAAACALAGATVFQFFGNATRGYIDTASLFYWWGRQWFNPQSETEHGLLIVPLAVGLMVRNLRFGVRNSKFGIRNSAWIGVVAMIGGLALHVLGFAAQQTRLSIIALLVFAWGVLRFGGGRRWGDAARFPLGFLVFAIPFNALDSVGFWLRLWVIKASAGLAHAAGIGVLQSGTQLVAPDGSYQYDVAAACSGVRSLMALLALALLTGYLNFGSWPRRTLLFLLCFPLIYLGNVLRITSIIFAAHWRGQRWGEGAHDVMGWGVFVVVLGGLLLAVKGIQRWWPEQSPPSKDTADQSGAGILPAPGGNAKTQGMTARRFVFAAAAVVGAAAVAEMLFLSHLNALPPRGRVGVRLAADGRNPVDLPVFLGTEWIGRRAEVSPVEREILPADTGYARRDYVAVADARQRVFLSVVLSGRDRTSIHRPELCLVGQGWSIDGTAGHRFSFFGNAGGDFPATLLRVRREIRTPAGVVA